MLEDLLGVDALARVQAHYLIEQVDEVGVAHPLVPTVVEALLKYIQQVGETRSEQLILFVHDFCIVTARHAKQPKVDP